MRAKETFFTVPRAKAAITKARRMHIHATVSIHSELSEAASLLENPALGFAYNKALMPPPISSVSI